MNTAEFRKALSIAKSGSDLLHVNIDHLFGYGLNKFQPTSTSLEAVAAVMRWQAAKFDGSWDEQELNDIRVAGRRKFIIC